MQTLEIKKGLLACIWVCAGTVSVAQTVTVGFAGRVVSPTCAWAISGAGVSGQAGAMAVPLVPTSVPASPSNLADNTFGKTVFSMGTTGCSHSYSVAPIVSISMRQTNGSYIQSGEKNFALEVGMESASNKRIKPNSVDVSQTPDTSPIPAKEDGNTDFYIQYRAVTGTPGAGDADKKPPTLVIHLNYV
jgi:hypothetical protein